VDGTTFVGPAIVERRLRVAGDASAAVRARQLVAHFRAERQRVDEARLLLNELVMAAQYEGVEFVDVRVIAFRGCLRLEVKRPHRRPMNEGGLQLTPAGRLGRFLIERLPDRWGDDGLSAWCELDGEWIAADVPVYLPGAVQPRPERRSSP
jgi:hypothetical protein